MKRCGMCWAYLPASEFYRNDEMRDGLFSVCKCCHRQRVTENRRAKLGYYRRMDRERGPGRSRAKNKCGELVAAGMDATGGNA